MERCPQRACSARSRRGSVLVESSFALLPLLALIFGVIDIAFAIFVKNTMQYAVRQGVRYAVTSQTMAGMGQDNSIKTVVKTYSMGLLDGLSPEPRRNGGDLRGLLRSGRPGRGVRRRQQYRRQHRGGLLHGSLVGLDGAAAAQQGGDAVFGFLGGHYGGYPPCRSTRAIARAREADAAGRPAAR